MDESVPPSEESFQALYRRYRPQRFGDVRGQSHVSETLRKAVRDGKVAHAYLFSGPRGTGKTSTARILAMALNCERSSDGEPDGTCSSCVEIRRGASLDVHELDAASNRKLDEMRDLLSRVALGTSGRWKVYIIDEVHQLTGDAASALLKTLEEPPAHVIFVLATTDPQKVLPTIRSRTQHFEFRLLGADVLAGLLTDINKQAGLGVRPEAIDLVVRRGHGSARDALSVLDQVAAAGSVEDEVTVVSEVVDALADRDPGRVLLAVGEGMSAGRDPRRLATDLLAHLRNGFLATQARGLVMLPDAAVAEVEEQARRLGTATVVRAMEVVGQAAIDMRESVDPRITLEVALVRLAAPAADPSPAAILSRLERLERSLGERAASGAPSSGAVDGPPPSAGSTSTPPARPALGAHRRPPSSPAPVVGTPPAAPAPLAGTAPAARAAPATPAPPAAAPTPPPTAAPTPPTAGSDLPSRDDLTTAWGDVVLPRLRLGVKAYLSAGRFVAVTGGAAVFAVPDAGLLKRAEGVRAEAEAALADHFDRPVPLRLIQDGSPVDAPPQGRSDAGAPASSPPADEEDPAAYNLAEMEDAGPGVTSPEQRLMEAFPGAEEVTP